jgi:hypothetical protein
MRPKNKEYIFISKYNAMSLINEIKEVYKAYMNKATAPEKFLDAKFVDGTIIRTDSDSFKVGDKVQVQDEQGALVNAPVGEHQLEDGTVLVIDGESKLTEVRAPEVQADVAASATNEPASTPVALADATPATPAEPNSDVSALADRVTAIEEMLKAILAKLTQDAIEDSTEDQAMKAVQVENEKLKAEVVKLSSTPAAKPVSTKKFEKTDTTNTNNKSSRLAELLEKNTKK